ncbi:MAG TPA: acetolactate synthase [Candidatus Nanopelagicaceae bacterium]|nr:acetolactate synthase [Candidatus Nanopelagicaceae bacterium]
MSDDPTAPSERETHGGDGALAAIRAHGVNHLFTLSGAHVFPIYDAAVHASPPLAIIDVRHEQTAVFAAEATGRLTRSPGLAVVTAGPGVTNSVSAIANAKYNGAPMLVIGGRAPANRWGQGALQEIDHPPLVAPLTKSARTSATTSAITQDVYDALELARSPHRGPTFLDIPMDVFFGPATVETLPECQPVNPAIHSGDLTKIAEAIKDATKPLLILGSDVWTGGAENWAKSFAEALGIPTVTNGTARGIIPRGHPLLVSKARSVALRHTDLVIVAGTPLDFRLGYGRFGDAKVVHIADSPDQIAAHAKLWASAAADIGVVFLALTEELKSHNLAAHFKPWVEELQQATQIANAKDVELLQNDSTYIHPARIYGELLPRLADDAIVIGDGGDFVSFAGKFVEPMKPGCWLDPGPYGCLGGGIGSAIAARLARPSAQIALLLGDGALGFSLAEIDSLVRHKLPVVMIVGNNSAWGLEKHPMQSLFGYDVAADLGYQTRYDQVAIALGAGGEFVTEASKIGAALDRGFASGIPYLINIATDPAIAYPRKTTGI